MGACRHRFASGLNLAKVRAGQLRGETGVRVADVPDP
jgi:hypothetical protein